MSSSVWDLSEPGRRCTSYSPGHQVHWIQFKLSMRDPGPVVPVTAAVDDDGRVLIEADGESLVRWNHRPDLLRAALDRFSGRAEWKPRWHLLLVPMESFMGGAQNVFCLATTEQWADYPCIPIDGRDVDGGREA